MKNKSLITTMLFCFYTFLANAQYCIPSSGGGNCITNVTLNTLNNTTAGCPNATNNFNIFTNTSNVFIGVSYTLQVSTNSNSNASVWIDWNQDSVFSTSEYFSVYNNSAIGSVGITLPLSTVLGLLRIRVRSIDPATMISATDACTFFPSGETEDYYIGATTISPCTTPPIGLIASASLNPVCAGDTATLSVGPIPTVSGLLYQWQFSNSSGGPWFNIGGAFNPSHTIVVNNYRCYRCKIFCSTNPGLFELSSVFCVNTFPSPISNDTITLCPNQLPYNWNGNSISSFGNYSDTFATVNGCDSIKNLVLLNQSVIPTIFNVNICQTQVPYTWNGNNYSTSGIYSDTLNSAFGCDSILMLNFTVHQTLSPTIINQTICQSQIPYIWNGINYSTSGTYVDTINSVFGCDSILMLNLSVIQTLPTNIINDTICQNQLPYVWNGNNYSISGTYSDTLNSVFGCDSIVVLNLTVNQTLPPIIINDTICQNQLPYVWNGNNYSSSGTYSDSLISVLGCDSILILNLLVKPSPSVFVSQSGPTLTATQTGVTYQWIDCATSMVISNATSSTFTATSNGSYAVVLNMNGCVDTSSCLTISNLHINNVEEHLLNSIVPNPNLGKFNISLNQNCEVIISNLLGQVIWRQKFMKGNHQIQIADAVTGIYNMNIINEQVQQNVRVFVQN